MTYLRADIAKHWAPETALEHAFALEGEVFRDVPGRRTLRVSVGEGIYFVKLHYGVGWGEVFKNWLQFKRPIIGAENEFEACSALHDVGIVAPKPAAYGASAGSMAARQSFVLCDELAGYESLEDVTETWFDHPPSAHTKHRLLYRVARFAREFHEQGFVHRDFYICHLLAHQDSIDHATAPLGVLDLHRARRFATLPDRWRRRDLAALLYSSLDLGYTPADWLRFIRLYSGRSLRTEWQARGAFWLSVLKRAHKLYREGQRKALVRGLYTP